MNTRENHHAVTRRKQSQRAAVDAVVSHVPAAVRDRLVLPVTITMTRAGPSRVDCDNACISQKFVRDHIAKWLRVDDGDDGITWVYQRVIEPAFGVRCTIETKGTGT